MILGPTSFILALVCAEAPPPAALQPREMGPGVFVVSYPDSLRSANAGWVVLGDRVLLIGAPDESAVPGLLEMVRETTGKKVGVVVLTQALDAESRAAIRLAREGIGILAASGAGERLRPLGLPATAQLDEVAAPRTLTGGGREVDLIPMGSGAVSMGLTALVKGEQVLFTGDTCVNGPRIPLPGSNTARWIRILERLRALQARLIIPGRGSTGGPEILERHERFLREIRRQVGHAVAQRWPFESVRGAVRIEPEWLVWMPYDTPTADDIAHVHSELTVPRAPFAADPFEDGESTPRALAVIGDSPHEPGHLESGLRPMFERAGIAVRFAVDPRALSRESLGAVQLLVMLRDGNSWPEGPDKPSREWMTPAQESAVVEFVESGRGFLALHNSTGLYPKDGPYLQLLGGTYEGHGPLERFRVEVKDASHPITQGISAYEVADEQHTPRPDLSRVHVILSSRSAGGVTAAAGWVRSVGKGRVAYLANGHTRDALGNPMFQKLVENAMHWCLSTQK